MTDFCKIWFKDTDFVRQYIPWLMRQGEMASEHPSDYDIDLIVRQEQGKQDKYVKQIHHDIPPGEIGFPWYEVDWTDTSNKAWKLDVPFQPTATPKPEAYPGPHGGTMVGSMATKATTSGGHQYFVIQRMDNPNVFELFEKIKNRKSLGLVCVGISAKSFAKIPDSILKKFISDTGWDMLSNCCLYPNDFTKGRDELELELQNADPIAYRLCKIMGHFPGTDNCNDVVGEYCPKNLSNKKCACYGAPSGNDAIVYKYLTGPQGGYKVNEMCYMPGCTALSAYQKPKYPAECPKICAEITDVEGSDYADVTVDGIDYKLDCSGKNVGVTEIGPHKPDHPGGNGKHPGGNGKHPSGPSPHPTPVWVWALLGVGVFVLLILIVFGAMLMRKRRRAIRSN